MANKDVGEKKNGFIGFFAKIGKFFKNLSLRIVRSFRDMWAELKKVTWPSRGELVNYTAVVLIFMAAMAVVVGLLDLGASALVQLITK